jgi:hypothetical protein
MNRLLKLTSIALVTLAAVTTLGCQSKPPPDPGAAPQNGTGSGGSGTGTNTGDTGTHSP